MNTMHFSTVVLALAAALIPARADEAMPLRIRHELQLGDVSLAMSPFRDGLQITVGGVWVVRGCELVVTRPPWAPHYYHGPSQSAVAGATVERGADRQTITMKHVGTADAFIGAESITLHADGRVEQTLDGVFNGDAEDCLIQWRMAALNPALFVGMPYEAALADGQTREGVVPVVAASAEQKDTTVAQGFMRLSVETRIGPLVLEVGDGAPITDTHAPPVPSPDGRDVGPTPKLILYDFRKDKYANPEEPLFWFGDLGTRFKKGERIRYRVVYHLPKPVAATATPKSISSTATIVPRNDAQLFPTTDPPTLIPAPKETKFADGHLDLTDFAIATRDGAGPPEMKSGSGRIFADALSESIRTSFGNLVTPRRDRRAPNPWPFSVMVGATDSAVPPEGYRLEIEAHRASVHANDDAGLRNAARTLFQLCEVTPDGRLLARAGSIRDWPSLRVRGVHLFTGGRGPDLHLRLIRRLLGALKMNHIVLQTDFLEWNSHPEIHHAELGMSRDDVRQILDTARQQGIEVTPLVMSLGHMHWMFHNNQNLDLAEDPEAKWAYCATNPRSYDFIFSVYDEALELFKPRWFHIGHDEFADRGRVPFRESSKPFTVEQLFLKDMERMVAYFKERGVRIMMWGDMLLAPGEAPDACSADSQEDAQRKRAAIPDDVIIADWHYVATTSDKLGSSLRVFHDAGHETIASGWSRPGNIVSFCRAAFEQKSLGYLQTTWAGYSLDPQSFAKELPQYASYVLAAEAAWNAENPPKPDDYPFMSHFLDLMRLTPLTPDIRGGWTADLSQAYNVPLAFTPDSTIWRGLGADYDLATVPAGDGRLKGVAFRLADAPADASRPSAIALRSRLSPSPTLPTEVEIELNAEAERVVILHATNFECARDQKVGEYELVYDDGLRRTYDVHYGRHVFAYSNPSAAPAGPIVWSGKTKAGAPIFLRAMVLERRGLQAKTGEASKRIARLIIRSADAPGSLVVLGVTGLIERSAP
jgi:hypothetical protein